MKKLVEKWNQLLELDKQTEKNPLPIVQEELFSDTFDRPAQLTHCTKMIHLPSIFGKEQFGGVKVISGNVEDYFSQTHFSPIPVLEGTNYSACLVLDTNDFNKREFNPTFYEDYKNHNVCYVFDDKGWHKFNKKEMNISVGCQSPFREEREWNVRNPFYFSLDDIKYIALEENAVRTGSGKEGIESFFIETGIKKKMNLKQLNTWLQKAHIIKFNRETKKFEYKEPLQSEPIKTVAYCPKMVRNPMVNSPIFDPLKAKKNDMKHGECIFIDENEYLET